MKYNPFYELERIRYENSINIRVYKQGMEGGCSVERGNVRWEFRDLDHL